MYQLLETIKLQDGVLKNISWHNKRLNNSRAELFGTTNYIALEKEIKIPDLKKKEIYKCRVSYSQNIESVEFSIYNIKPVKTLKLIYDDEIIYNHKYIDRSCFEKHMRQINEDDILIVRFGFITDVSFANIAFFDGKYWRTPSQPLLKGTKRMQLLEKKILIEDDIRPTDLKHFKMARLINAMLDLNTSSDIEINNIIF